LSVSVLLILVFKFNSRVLVCLSGLLYLSSFCILTFFLQGDKGEAGPIGAPGIGQKGEKGDRGKRGKRVRIALSDPLSISPDPINLEFS